MWPRAGTMSSTGYRIRFTSTGPECKMKPKNSPRARNNKQVMISNSYSGNRESFGPQNGVKLIPLKKYSRTPHVSR